MADLRWTEEANRWLQDIFDYIAKENLQAARRTVEGIYDKAQLLREFPRIGFRYEHITDREVRILLYGHYRIAYLVRSDEQIDILGVFHSAMDIDQHLD